MPASAVEGITRLNIAILVAKTHIHVLVFDFTVPPRFGLFNLGSVIYLQGDCQAHFSIKSLLDMQLSLIWLKPAVDKNYTHRDLVFFLGNVMWRWLLFSLLFANRAR